MVRAFCSETLKENAIVSMDSGIIPSFLDAKHMRFTQPRKSVSDSLWTFGSSKTESYMRNQRCVIERRSAQGWREVWKVSSNCIPCKSVGRAESRECSLQPDQNALSRW